jgi:isopentenyl phosphate kinase
MVIAIVEPLATIPQAIYSVGFCSKFNDRSRINAVEEFLYKKAKSTESLSFENKEKDYSKSTGQQISEAMDKTAQAIERIKNGEEIIYKQPAAIERVKQDERYQVEINDKGHAVVKNVKDNNGNWVKQDNPIVTKEINQPKQANKTVNTENDDLLTAIAKLGGLSREESVKKFGIDPAQTNIRKAGLLPVFRKDAGLSFDDMAKTLHGYGYPVSDNGQYSPNALYEALDDALRGREIGTSEYHKKQMEQKYAERMREEAEFYDAISKAGSSTWEEADNIEAVADSMVTEITNNNSTISKDLMASTLKEVENVSDSTSSRQDNDTTAKTQSIENGNAEAASSGERGQQESQRDSVKTTQSQGLQGSQILLTYDDLAHEQRRKNFIATIQQLLKWKTVPIINENDVVATDEIKFGDNDALSALVAQAIGADRLVILTDVAGLYDRDPRVHPNAKMIAVVPRITNTQLKQPKESHTRQSNRPSSQSVGTGGMYSKLLAAQRASEAGIETWLVKGDRQHILPSLCQAQRRDMKLGTCIEGRT